MEVYEAISRLNNGYSRMFIVSFLHHCLTCLSQTRIDDKTPKRSDEQTFFKPVETLASYFEGPINQKLRETMILLRKVLNSENWDWISDFIDRGVSPLIELIRRISQIEK